MLRGGIAWIATKTGPLSTGLFPYPSGVIDRNSRGFSMFAGGGPSLPAGPFRSVGVGDVGEAIPVTSGLILCCDDLSPLTTSGSPVAVDQWDDRSGLDNHLVMATANARPILVASDSDLGGVRTLNTSTGVGPFAHKGMMAANLEYGAFTKFFVVTGHVTGAGYYDFHDTDANNADYTYSSTNGLYAARGGTKSEKNPGALWGAYGATTFKTQRVEFGGTHATHKLFLNGVDTAAGNGSFTGNPGTGALTEDWFFGVDSSLGTSTGAKWAAILIYDRLLTPTETAQVEAYLQARYGHY